MAWVVWSVNTMTGAREGILPVNAGDWARDLNASGTVRASFPVGDAGSVGMPGRYLSEPISRTLVFEWNGTPIAAGIVWVREYDKASSMVTLTCSDPWSIFGKRLVAAYSSAGVQGTSVGWSNLSLSTQVKRAIEQATAGAMFGLPILLPADVAGTVTQTYKGYHFPMLKDVITDLMNTQYGPDIDFLPEWAPDGKFRWRLLAGEPTPALLVWNLTAEKDGAHSLKVTEDGNNVVNHVLATGQGTEVDMLVRSAISGASPYPALVKVANFSQEADGAKLQARADAELAASLVPVEQWSFSVVTGSEYDVTQLRPGVGVRAFVQGDPWISDGRYDLLLVGYSGSLGPDVKLQFQPLGA